MPILNGAYVRSNQIYDAYIEAMESGSTSDFPTYLQEKLNRIMLQAHGKVLSSWRRVAGVMNMTDFKTYNIMTPLSESDDLQEVAEGGEYQDSELRDSDNVTMKLSTYGRTFSITRQAIINDDFNQLQQQPDRFGRAAARTLAKKVISVLESPGTAYDGVTFFGDHKQEDGSTSAADNLIGSAALSRASLRTAIERMRKFTDIKGNRLSLTPQFLYIPVDLEFTAMEILKSEKLIGQGADAAPVTDLNVMNGSITGLQVVVEPFLTSADTWYLVGDINDTPVLKVGFLNGKETPDLLLKDSASKFVLGGSDPYSFEFDEIKYKVRQDWVVKPVEFRGIIKNQVAAL